MSEEVKLLPCPFCGSDAVSMSFSATLESPDPASRFVECEDCAASGPAMDNFIGDEEAKAKATDAWNTRPPTKTEGGK